ncbi:hypothetical protein CkaCkLH20_06006 [Colletotrichum karsti]|uniref:Hydrophobin n=1 Tax=Colletotrichum karsti TaxID=1095194 RepID=A0A9P6LKC3_9PEZI|nr:uncharacterized protein CkaCkLH20_06006 [Colletotrichum karsti]KAF9876598.1 hypothetical protein CkaCkLH20_06006 [Colletotrichum karsti]
MMRTSIVLTLLTTVALAKPIGDKVTRQTADTISGSDICEENSGTALCSLGSPLCCRTDVDGLTTMDCLPPIPNMTPIPETASLNKFQMACLVLGNRRPRCCTLNAAGQALFCEELTTSV